ncbi:hypothetical protein Tco_0598412, partial [Tanacetum coccineum]
YQAKPTKKHLEAIKRVFWYLKGTINMCLWYLKDSAMSLIAYADADHAGCQDSRRSTSGSAQFLGDRLVSWSSKKQRSTAISTTEAEYIAMFGCLPLLFAVTMSSTLDQSTSTYVTISSESKWKIEWLNSTSWKRTINLRTYSQKHYQENEYDGRTKCSRSTTDQNSMKQIVPRSHVISVDILSNTNFFRAFTASASVPAIYMQQFWNTMKYDEKTGVYSCQVDEQWFDLSADLLRKALAITPVNPAHPFELPPSGNTVIDFINELGYPEPVEIVSIYTGGISVSTMESNSNLNQPVLDRKDIWQAVMGKVYSRDQLHFSPHMRVTKQSEDPKKKNDFILGNLKFVPKGETVEVFGMVIPDPLIIEAIQQSSYYPKYLEMVATNTKKTPHESASEQPATKRAPPKKATTATPSQNIQASPAPTRKPSIA